MWPDGYTLHYRPGGAKNANRQGAETLLTQLSKRLGWGVATYTEQFPLGLKGTVGKVSLEPGSQLEFSANPVATVLEAQKMVDAFEKEVDAVTSPWGVCWIGLGMNPSTAVEDMDVIPLTRYHIMTQYLGRRGRLATSMMRLTSSIQINFDYSSEAEAIQMLQAALAVTPVSYALFGNSPFSNGKPNGWLSYRSEIWRNTDPDRSGLFHAAFEDGFGFDRYAELAWKRPLMFVQNRKGQNVESQGRNLIEISQNLLGDCEVNPENELNTLRQFFAEARLKPGYVEVRSIDGLRVADRYPAVAFWTGLMYDEQARLLAIDRLGTLSAKLRDEFWILAGKDGLRATLKGLTMRNLAAELLEASRRTLVRRGKGEEVFLKPLEKNISESKNPADRVLELFNGPWQGSMAELIRYCASRSA